MARTLYQKFRDLWKDKPDKTTPVTAEALNHFEQGIYDNSQNMALKEIYDDTAISMGRKSETTVGICSYAVGLDVEASDSYAHAEGYGTKATEYCAHAEGANTTAGGRESHAEGLTTTASSTASHAEGEGAVASGAASHAEGYHTIASGRYSHAEGYGNGSEGANGEYSHVEGYYTQAVAQAGHAEGYRTQAAGNYAHAEGYQTKAYGTSNHAEGHETTAGKEQISVYGAHSEGAYTTASGDYSHAEGIYTEAIQSYSHAEGYSTKAIGQYQHVQGKYNIPNDSYALIVGNGTSDNNRSNACYIDWQGNVWFAGDISNDKYSLNDIGSIIGDEDISSQCSIAINEQTVTITIPISGMAVNGNKIAGGFFVGAVITGIPPLLLSADILVVQYSVTPTQVEGTAELINTFASTAPQFGDVFDGNIEVVSFTQDSATTCKGSVKITFNLATAVTLNTFTIFKSSRYYYPIAHLRNDLTERIESLEQRIAELEGSE